MKRENERKIEAFWEKFLREAGLGPLRWHDCFAFGSGAAMADELLALVLSGQKRATTAPLPSYEAEGERPPRPGDHSIVLDGAGEPACVIRTRAVTILPFGEVTWDLARREGEDENLDSWQQGHIRFITEDAREFGYEFSWEMPVVFEDFDLVYPLADGKK